VTDGPIAEDCISEVRCLTTTSFGSGYLLNPGLVLTACHIIDDTGNDLPDPINIEVRPLADAKCGGGWREANLVWPRAHEWRQHFAEDIALLQFTPDAHTRAIATQSRLGWGNLPKNQPMGVTAVGFPKFKQRSDDTRDTQQVSGEVAPLSSIKAQEWDVEYKGRQPKNQEDWKGLSGAALFAGDRLVGIISRKVRGETDFQAGMADFKAARLEPALQNDHFKTLVGPEPAVPQVIRTGSDLPALVCLIDRDPQEAPFRDRLRELLAMRPARPLLCLITGRREHCADELVNRFALQTVPRLCKRPDVPMEFRPITWPRRVDEAGAELRELRRILWNQIADLDEPTPTDDRPFCRRLSESGRPNLFQSDIAAEALGPGQAQLFAEWLRFFGGLAALGLDRPPVHAIMIKDATEKQVKQWIEQINVPEHLDLHPLRELAACVWGDFGEWHRRVYEYRPLLGAEIGRLVDDIEDALGGQADFTVEALKKAVRNVIRQQQARTHV
jgi:inactive STAND/Trypsin-like peptidase domain